MNSALILQATLAHYTANKTKTLSLLDAALNHGETFKKETDINEVVIDLFKTLSISELCINSINSIIQNNIVPANTIQQPAPSPVSAETPKE